ncbi:MAG: hypothetical protein E5V72_16645 [Mesorhizobium sp.]|nr:MAG: hypothetical protein E5V72_16645 [Mesorhizobium sp.]
MSADPIVEPCVCHNIFFTGAGPLQFMGDNLRLTLFVRQRSTCDGSIENAVVAKIVGTPTCSGSPPESSLAAIRCPRQ